MKKINDKDIEMINKLYLQYGTYTGVANVMGISPATVKRYLYPIYLLDDNSIQPAAVNIDDWDLEDVDDFAEIMEDYE